MMYQFEIENIDEEIKEKHIRNALGSIHLDQETGQLRVMSKDGWIYID